MACGFGASVLLFFMIIKNAAPEQLRVTQEQSRAEITEIELDLREGRALLAQLQNTLDTTDRELIETKDLSARIAGSLQANEDALASAEEESKAREEALEKLKTDVKAIDQESSKLRDEVKEEGGPSARAFVGQGDRQYLTGLRVGGDRILILLDASASMLDETIVNVIRRRNMPDDQKVQSRKWQRALTTVEWLMSQFPLDSKVQIYAFNTNAQPLLEGTASTWLEVKDAEKLEAMAQALKKLIPSGGTSLHNAFAAAAALRPEARQPPPHHRRPARRRATARRCARPCRRTSG